MIKIAAPVSILAVAVLTACASQGPRSPTAPASASPFGSAPLATQEVPYRAGTGVVQSVNPAPAMASAGPTASRSPAAPASGGMQRLGIKMDNGQMVYVDTPSKDFSAGTRVQLTENFEIRKQ
jgi:hypothetical protein